MELETPINSWVEGNRLLLCNTVLIQRDIQREKEGSSLDEGWTDFFFFFFWGGGGG
jgi:hypothetical protein